jgi:putative addiction module component (TIGR02574 family)
VFEEALALPPDKRLELADQLLSSLDPADQERIDRLWIEECKSRLAAFERGEMKAIPAEEVFEAARKKLAR